MTPGKKASKKVPKQALKSPVHSIGEAGAVSPTDIAGAVSPTDVAGAVGPTDVRALLAKVAPVKGVAFYRMRIRANEFESARVTEYRFTLSNGAIALMPSEVIAECLRMETLLAAARRGIDITRPPWSTTTSHDVEAWLLATYPPKGL